MNLPDSLFFTITPDRALPVIFYIFLFIFIGHWLILAYHWLSYNNDHKKTLLTLVMYGVGGSVCLLLMAFMLNQM